MKRIIFIILTAVFSICAMVMALASSLDPPPEAIVAGQPVATMKSLNDIEPRVSILSLPFSITNSGSYYLVRSLTGTNGITIDADDIQLDLGGYSIEGASNNYDSGITVMPDVMNVTIKNGAISDWAKYGIDGTNGQHFQVINILANLNGQGGIRIGNNALVAGCTATENGGDGISVTETATIMGSKAHNNQADGFRAFFGCTIVGCTSTRNKANGIFTEMYCTVRDCTSVMNDGDGIEAHASCRIENNNCGDNGFMDKFGAGIMITGPGNRIKENNITANDQGIVVQGVGNWVENNNVIDNTMGIEVTGQGNFIIRNGVGTPLETNSPTHFNIIEGNQYAKILENMGSGFTNNNPWANVRLTIEQP